MMMKQIVAVTAMNLRSLPQRMGTAWVIVIGIAVTVAVMVSVLAMAEGFTKTLKGTARTDRAIVLRSGSEGELASTISRENTQTIMDAPGVRKDAAGRPIASWTMAARPQTPSRHSPRLTAKPWIRTCSSSRRRRSRVGIVRGVWIWSASGRWASASS